MDFAHLPIWIAVFAISGSLHEFGHAWAAWKLGDPTAERQGRLTVNPLVHVDPMGLVVLIVSSLAGFGFGWMKPVPVSPWNFKNPRQGMMLTSAAGPISNILQAIVLTIIWSLILTTPSMRDFAISSQTFFGIAIGLNIILAAFNLLPIPPLDGFAVLDGFLSPEASVKFGNWMHQWGPLLLVAVFLLPPVRMVILTPIYMLVQTMVDTVSGLLV